MITIAAIVLLLCIVAGCVLLRGSLRALSADQKCAIGNVGARYRGWSFLAAAVFFAWAVASWHIHDDRWFVVAAVSVLLLGIAYMTITIRRLSRLGLPPVYLRNIFLSAAVLAPGALFLIAAILYKSSIHVTK